MHHRTVIRHGIVAVLTGATNAGARVQGSRIEPYRDTELPAISVYTAREPIEPDSGADAPRELTRELRAEIAIWVALNGAAPDPFDPLDDITEQVETVMDANRFLGGAAGDSVLEDTEIRIHDDRGDPLLAVATLTYVVTYRTTPGVTATDDFLVADTTTQIGGAGADNTARDQVNVRT